MHKYFCRRWIESRVEQYIFILYKRITRFSCEYSVKLTVLWNLNMHICISISIHSLFSHVLRLHFNTHAYICTCFRCARNLYYANRFCRVLPSSKCYSSKTCLMCIILTQWENAAGAALHFTGRRYAHLSMYDVQMELWTTPLHSYFDIDY